MIRFRKKGRILFFSLITTFILLGIFFSSLLLHEGIHIIQLGKPESICYDFQQATFMHIENDFSDEVYSGKIDYEKDITFFEKIAVISQYMFIIIIGLGIGFIFGRITLWS